MNIAVIDVAASEGGALSILMGFCDALRKVADSKDQWYIVTSIIDIEENDVVHNIKIPDIKKSWLKRIQWEKSGFSELMKSLKIDMVFSLQNTAFPKGDYSQIVYFHNILLLQPAGSFVDFRLYNVGIAIRANLIGPYTRKSWENADRMIVQGESIKRAVSKYYDAEKIDVIPSDVMYKGMDLKAGKIKGYIYPTSSYSYKNVEALIAAEQKLNSQGIEVEILVTLNGTENGYAKRVVRLGRKVKGIRFIGVQRREKLFEMYREYGLVMPSKLESYGIPIIEAMMMGTVVTGVRRPYFIELTDHYSRTYVSNDDDSLYEALIQGLKDENAGNYQYINGNSWMNVIETVKNLVRE